jgi:hypothetical protein
VGVVDRRSVASVSRVEEVCKRYGMRVCAYSYSKQILVESSSGFQRFVECLDWELLGDEELEGLAVSWALKLCFENDPAHQLTNPCSEIYLPHEPRICTL